MVRWLVVLLCVALLIPGGGAQWPQYRHDNGHAGMASESGGIRALHERFAFSADGAIVSSPAVAEVDGERLTFFGSYVALSTAGTVYAVRGDGSLAWSNTPLTSTGGYLSSPTVAELGDGDGPEVIIASLDDSTLRVFDAATGDAEWTATLGTAGTDLLAGSPIVADLMPGVPGNEVALGGSKSDDDGNLVIFDRNGNERWSYELDGPSWSTPMVADLDGDGIEEMAIASGVPASLEVLFPAAKTGGGSLFVFERSGDSWDLKWSDKLSGASLAAPAAGDLDGDGDVELVIGAEGGQIRVYDGATGTRLATSSGWSDTVGLSSAGLGDVDGDGEMEIVAGSQNGVFALAFRGGALETDHRLVLPTVPVGDGGSVDPWVGAAVALGDLDGDGDLEIAASTLPINIDPQDILNSDALPGKLFAFHGEDFRYPEGLLWEMDYPNDGTISGPAVADLDGDGYAEVIAGEGVPLIGDGKELHVIAAANPIVRGIAANPASPMAEVAAAFVADVVDEDHDVGDLTYAWDFGDGATSSDAEPAHAYAAAGDYTVTVSATDPDGHAWTRSVDIAVRPFRAFDLSADDPSVEAAPGQALALAATITNTGPFTDTYTFSPDAADATRWAAVPPAPVTLAPGESASVSFAVVVPGDVAAATLSLRANVDADPLVQQVALWDVDVPVTLDIQLDAPRTPFLSVLDPLSTAPPPGKGTVRAAFIDGQPVVGLDIQVSQTPRPFGELGAVREMLATSQTVPTDATGTAAFHLDDPQAKLPGSHAVTAQAHRLGERYLAFDGYRVTVPPVLY